MLLPDINVWLAITFDFHKHHASAKRWFDALSIPGCCFCRFTQQGFLRLASNSTVFGVHALGLRQAWEAYDAFRSDDRISFVNKPADLETLCAN